MRKLFAPLFLALFLFAVTAPLQVVMQSGGIVRVTVNTTQAACANGDVELGVPLLNGQKCVSNSGEGGAIVAYLKMALQLLTGGVGGVIVLMLVIAGIQYIVSAGDPGNIKKAKDRIVNAITALILFVMSYAILGFLIPGGIF